MVSTLLSYQVITRDIEKSIARVTSDRMTQREKTYYLAEISKIDSIDDFMSNQRVLSFAMRAFGLEDMLNSRALIRKVLEGGIDDPRSLANTLADPRFREFAEAFNFKRYGDATTSFSRTQQGTVDRFLRQALETNAGRSNEGVRLALYFERKAPTINSVYSLLADRAIYKVIETALDLPSSLPAAGIEKQAAFISQRMDIADLKDPKELGKFLRRFATLWDVANGTSTTGASGIVGIARLTAGQVGISSDTLASIQALRLNRGRDDMQSSVYVSLSAQKTLLKRLDSIANNVANASTPGYRAEEIAFSSLVSDRTSHPVSFAVQGKEYLSTRSGALTRTDGPLDMAIAGDAWFAIESAQGLSYTRDGRFQMSATGDLVTVTGDRVLDSGGAGLQLNPAGGPIVVARDGAVTQDGRTVGAVGLFQIPESANLRRAANGSVIPDQPAVPQLDFNRVAVAQGFIERSNVDPVLEMTRLIAIQRAFDSIASTVNEIEASMNDSIRALAG